MAEPQSVAQPLWTGMDLIGNHRVLEAVENLSSLRGDLFKKLFDPRRDIYDECGYPRGYLPSEMFQELYDRNAIAARVVEIMPKECWQKQPTVYEDKDNTTETPFEESWAELGNSLNGEESWYRDEEGSPIWDYLMRADILSGIGQYGVIFLGIDDGKPLNVPAEGVNEVNSVSRTAPSSQKDTTLTDISILPSGPTSLNSDGSVGQYRLTFNTSVAKPQTGTDNNPETSPSTSKARRKLLYIRCFPEYQARVVAYEANRTSPRFGRPVMYSITFQDPNNYPTGGGVAVGYTPTTMNVHWTRCIHIVDNQHQPTSSEVAGAPRMRPVLNHLLALDKIYGGSGEGYWTSCVPKTVLETHPSLGGDVIVDKQDVRNQLENMQNSMQKYLVLLGMSAKTLAPMMVIPTPFVEAHLQAICIKIPVALRIFMGSERGQLASGQDDGQHNDNIRGRNTNHTIPKIVCAFVNRCLMLGCLIPPKKSSGYGVYWPDLETQSAVDKANVAYIRTQAMGQYVSLGINQFMSELDYLVDELGYDQKDAELIIKNAEARQEEVQADAEALAKEHGLVPDVEGYKEPTPPPDKTPIKVKDGERLVHPDTVRPPTSPKASSQQKRGNQNTT